MNTKSIQPPLLAIEHMRPPPVQERAEQADRLLAAACRPHTVADCAPGGSCHQRPCPWVSCRYHLLISDIKHDGTVVPWQPIRTTGKPNTIAPDWQIDETELHEELLARLRSMPDTCALDVTRRLDGSEPSTEQIGAELGIGAWAAQKAEHEALSELRDELEVL